LLRSIETKPLDSVICAAKDCAFLAAECYLEVVCPHTA